MQIHKELLAEFDARTKAPESGADKGFTLDELKALFAKLRKERNGKPPKTVVIPVLTRYN